MTAAIGHVLEGEAGIRVKQSVAATTGGRIVDKPDTVIEAVAGRIQDRTPTPRVTGKVRLGVARATEDVNLETVDRRLMVPSD